MLKQIGHIKPDGTVGGAQVDYDFHGVVGIRILNASPEDELVMARQLGPYARQLHRDPDIIIRFVDELQTGPLTYLGLNHTGYSKDSFYLLGFYDRPVKVRIPFEKIGRRCEIICERGLDSVPLLLEIIRLTFLKKGYIPVHGTAFIHDGKGILAMGWAKGGKTEALLGFAKQGATYVGDEMVVITNDGRQVFGLPVSICVWQWQVQHVPGLIPDIGRQNRVVFRVINLLDRLFTKHKDGMLRNTLPMRALGSAMPILRRQLKVKFQPQDLFPDRCLEPIAIDQVLLLMSHDRPDIDIEECDPGEVALRMAHSNENEMNLFLEYYQAFKFAFPHLTNPFLERAGGIQASLLANAMAGKLAHKVVHPYPVPLGDLYRAIESLFERQHDLKILYGDYPQLKPRKTG